MPLLLLPNVLHEGESDLSLLFPKGLESKIGSLQGLIAENEKEARRYLKRFIFPEGRSFRDVPIKLLNEHTKKEELSDLLAPIKQGELWGLISDAGLPCLADPGAHLVLLARQKGIVVDAVCGPSSLFLALMLSGLGAQNFAFHGYLPREEPLLKARIKTLEKESEMEGRTQLCIETPYRGQALLQTLIQELKKNTLLSVCVHLTAPDQEVHTYLVDQWRKNPLLELQKRPAIFLFSAQK
jgi:16S rRNA (cytidine1402-2'-O)-methyltransferase